VGTHVDRCHELANHTGFYSSVLGVHRHVRFLAAEAKHRLPELKDFEQAVTTVRNQQRPHLDPLLGIEHLVTRNPEAFLEYV